MTTAKKPVASESTTPLAMERVDTCGAMLQAGREGQTIWVSIAGACDSLGVDLQGQRRKLAKAAWAAMDIKSVTASDGKNYETLCISHRSLPMWLASIHPSKVKPAVRAPLIRMQQEAHDALADHFFGKRGAAEPHVDPAFLRAFGEQIANDVAARFSAELKDVRKQLAGILAEQGAANAVVLPHADHPERWAPYGDLRDATEARMAIVKKMRDAAKLCDTTFAKVHGATRREFTISGYKRLRLTQCDAVIAFLERLTPASFPTKPPPPPVPEIPGQRTIFEVIQGQGQPKRRPA